MVGAPAKAAYANQSFAPCLAGAISPPVGLCPFDRRSSPPLGPMIAPSTSASDLAMGVWSRRHADRACVLMVPQRSMRMANARPAAVRAKFQGEFLDSSVDIGVDRLALLRSWVPGLIASMQLQVNPCLQMPRRDWAYAKIRYARRSSRNSDSHRLIEWHMLSIIADCFLLSHGLSGPCGCAKAPLLGARELMPQ